MKKFFSKIIMLLCLTAMVCCSNESLGTTSTNKKEKKAAVNINYNLCKMTAETQIMQTAQYDDKWAGAEITDHYYWYNPMIEDAPAYIEFKVTKDGEDAGYVMVSTTELDFEVPEYHTEGKAMYECLQHQANSTDITATRFNSFDYMAEFSNGRGEKNRVFYGDIAYMNNSKGGRGGSDYEEYLSQYKAFRNKIGGIGGSKAELDKHYEMKKDNKTNMISRGDLTPQYSATIISTIQRPDLLPTYAQHWRTNKNAHVGCAPVAATMLLAYWYLYHKKTNLFSKQPVLTYDFSNVKWYKDTNTNYNEKNVVETLANNNYMKVLYGDTVGGIPNPYYLWHGLYKYIWDKGYNHWVIRHYFVDANEHTCENPNITLDWNNIFTEIQESRPAILAYYDSDEKAKHFAVIYSVEIHRNPWFGTVNETFCEINTGFYTPTKKRVCTSSWLFNEVITCKIWNR